MKSSLPEPISPDVATAPLKVLLVVEPGTDGVFRHVEGLVHYLIERGQQVFLAYSDKRGSPDLVLLVSYVEANGGKCLNLKVGNAPTPGDVSAFYQLWNFAREIRPDIIHSQSSKAGILARALALAGVKGQQVYTPHAYYGLTPRSSFKNQFFNSIESVFGHIGRTINTSEDEQEFALKKLGIHPKRSVLIYNTVNTRTFVPASAEEKLNGRRELGLPEKGMILGSMGRLSFQKDPHTLYRSFKLLDQTASPCHLFHVGKGEDKDSVDQLIKELDLHANITRLPYLGQPAKFYKAIDALFLPSRYEGCPTVALEALACNIPLILSEAPGTNFLTELNLSHCWSAPIGDAPGFARAISEWLTDFSKGRPSNHRDVAIALFSSDRIYGQNLELYRNETAFSSP
jgi:glycosyltransferase involved in cell wall biosynthesis